MTNRQGAFADLLKFSAGLPWKVSVGLAAVSGLGFHIWAVALSTAATVSRTNQPGSVVVQGYIHIFAVLLQFIVPAGFLVGATASVLSRRRSGALIAAARAGSSTALKSMSWRDFERLVGEAFRRQGFTVTGFGGQGPDGGVDLGLMKNGERFLVQCKHWKKQQVGVTVVRELNGVMAAQGAKGGFVVAGGSFTREAREFAKTTKVTLVDGAALERLIGEVKATAARESAPACPRCGTAMVRRHAKKGKFAGTSFWGCGSYPKCVAIVQIP